MNTEKNRPVPKASVFVDTAPFWAAAQSGKLLVQYCKDTGKYQYYPRPVSVYTGKRNLEWREVSGKGVIYAHTVIRVPGPGLEGRLPLLVAIVELDEGVRLIANILDASPEELSIGKRVQLAWDQLDGNVAYPAFSIERA